MKKIKLKWETTPHLGKKIKIDEYKICIIQTYLYLWDITDE